MEDNNKDKVNLFISYAHDDKYYDNKKKPSFEELEKFIIKAAQLAEIIETWTDADITLGANWDEKIRQELDRADIVILVISQYFLNSQYIIKTELDTAYKKDATKKCVVMPLYFEKCNLDKNKHEFLKLQGYPSPENPINEIDEKDRPDIYTNFQKKIESVAIEILEKKKKEKNTSARSTKTVAELQVQSASRQDLLHDTKPTENNANVYAVIIANYQFSKLVDKDIQNVRVNLSQLENTFRDTLKFTNVFTFDNKDSASVSKELEKIIRKCPIESTFLLYYSGHGLIESNSFYWASEDTELNPEDNNRLVTPSAISAEYIKRLLEKDCKAKHKVLISDCCYSNAFLNNSLSVNHNTFIKQNFAIRDTYYFFSSSETEVSLYPTADPDRPTYFTEAFLKALKTGVEPNYEFCSLGQIINLTQKELIRLRDTENSGIPDPIKPDDDPNEEIRFCANPNYVRRSEQKKLTEVIESPNSDDLTDWARSNRNDPDIKIAISMLITRHQADIEMIKINSEEENNNDLNVLNKMIKFLEFALEKKTDPVTYNKSIQNYIKKSYELSESQKTKSDNPIIKKDLQTEKEFQSENRLVAENSKAQKEENKFTFTNNNNTNDKRSNPAQLKRSD